MRLAEADAAAKRVQRAGTTLRKTLSDIKLHSRLETDFDRLAAAVFEFERRVLAVRDSAAALGTLVEGVTIERLSARADLWVRYVRDARPLVDAERLRELDALLK